MKRMATPFIIGSLGLVFTASTCHAQMYRITDLGSLSGSGNRPSGINNLGQVVGASGGHAFRTAPNSPINPATDDLGTLGGMLNSEASAINASGQVVGYSFTDYATSHSFRTAPNSPINPATDDIGTLGGAFTQAYGINDSGQVVGCSGERFHCHAFRTAPNTPINAATDDVSIGFENAAAYGINASGQVVGNSSLGAGCFRTAPNSPINPATDDLGPLGFGWGCRAFAINASGQVVGLYANKRFFGDGVHAFRTAPDSPINPATDDLGTFGGPVTQALGINATGEVVGSSESVNGCCFFPSSAFIYSNGVMHDLNKLIPAGSGWNLTEATGINDAGQIVGLGVPNGFLLTPIYKALVRPPINADGSSVFHANRGVLPVKFRLTQDDVPTCALPPATITVTRTAGGTVGSIDESIYSTQADSGSNFRSDSCQYMYHLAASSLGVGTYRVDISIEGIPVGHAVFALE